MRLLLVESPTKATTLKQFLGKDYEVAATYGHIRDLPKGKLGIDTEKDFEPQYVIPTKSRKTVTALQKAAEKADEVILASVDYDEPTLIQYPDGLVRMERVGKFIDWLLDSNLSPSQFRVAAFHSDSHRISFKRIKHVVRHPIKEKLLKIKTGYGRAITVTASHSLFQKGADGTINTVAGKNLKKGDSILVPVSIPRGRENLAGSRIDILKAIYENKELLNNVFIKSSGVAEYRRSQLLAPRNGNTPQLAPRMFLTSGLRKKLLRYRFDKGWSQKALAKQVECSQSNISEWESGQGNPTLEPGQKYLNALGMKFDTLVAKRELTVGPSSIEQAIAQALKTQWRDSRKSKARTWQPLIWFTWEELEQNFSDDKTIELSRSNHSHRMPRFIPVDEDLMIFLGFFTAEGSFLTHGKYTRFSFGPKTHGAEGTHIEHIREISHRLFNIAPSDFKEKTGHSVVLNSTLVTFFLKEVMGIKRGAEHKEVPHLVFNVPRALQFAFLQGYFLGDGTLGRGGVAFNTISPSLAAGISYLLLQNGILSGHSLAISKKPSRKPLHQITITGKEKLLATLPVWQEHYKASPLKEYCGKSRNIKQNFSLVKERTGDVALLRVKNIEKVGANGCYVYDFSVEGENFVCGNGGVCAHNTDEDREGEAIAWHLANVLELKNPERIVFHEITKEAIQEALKAPRFIDENRVAAQQARRILDRLVGYKLSPFLWRKVSRGLSAGRVQSVAVRLIADREQEIKDFKPQEYWSIEADLEKDGKVFRALLSKNNGKAVGKLEIENKKEADGILKELTGANYIVETLEQKNVNRNPLPPFTTSTMQQTAGSRLRYPARLTMQLAQQLYEQGYITYHRTDSLNLSQFSLSLARSFIEQEYGKDYLPESPRRFKSKAKGAQEAHEAIRPTQATKTPGTAGLTGPKAKLYELIWQRFMASQMSPAVFQSTAADIAANQYTQPQRHGAGYTFRATGQTLQFDGFLKVYLMKFEEADLPNLSQGESLSLKELLSLQHFTQPPARYTEATLIKALEHYGIGRPSTYAPIISTVQERGYVERDENRRLFPTELGGIVNSLLVEHFPTIVDIGFTADMEEDLDEVAQGKKQWVPMLREFYEPFAKNLLQKEEEVQKKDLVKEVEGKICPECGSPLVMRFGRFGQFYACSTFPECKHTEPLEKNKPKELGITCPKCEKGELVAKKTRRGKLFYACNRYPECDFALWDKPTGEKCEKCGSLVVEGTKKRVGCSNPECELSLKKKRSTSKKGGQTEEKSVE